jgi:transposase
MEQPTRFIGMDVHKETIVVAVTAVGDVGKATPYGTFPNTAAAVEKLVRHLRQASSGPLMFCYEAGPCGYGIHRTLTKLGEDCMVVAPSMIPRKPGDRQRNDKRDASSLAVLYPGGLQEHIPYSTQPSHVPVGHHGVHRQYCGKMSRQVSMAAAGGSGSLSAR